ncbi:hypothetical protein STENM327S_06566 [Streptomyces tendae]
MDALWTFEPIAHAPHRRHEPLIYGCPEVQNTPYRSAGDIGADASTVSTTSQCSER